MIQEVTCSIQQGLCLGPLPFIMYKIHFERFLSKFYNSMLADDISVSSSGKHSSTTFKQPRKRVRVVLH